MSLITTQVEWQCTAECPVDTTTAVDVWLMDHKVQTVKSDLQFLSAKEQQSYSQFKDKPAADWYLQHHLFRRRILAMYLNTSMDRVVFLTSENGKPYVDKQPKLHFNLSHTRGQCLLAVSRVSAVGIDIEPLRQVKNWQQIAERVFPVDWFKAPYPPLTAENFIHYWTRFEAQQKCFGQGVFGPAAEQQLNCQSFIAEQGFIASVCADKEIQNWNFYKEAFN